MRRRALVVYVLGVTLLTTTCSTPGPFRLDVDRSAGDSWTATGHPVDAGAICDSGRRTIVEYRDAVGSALSEFDARRRLDQSGNGSAGDVRLVSELSCSDGSGVITLLENPQAGTWSVIEARGGYTGLTGGGTLGELDPETAEYRGDLRLPEE